MELALLIAFLIGALVLWVKIGEVSERQHRFEDDLRDLRSNLAKVQDEVARSVASTERVPTRTPMAAPHQATPPDASRRDAAPATPRVVATPSHEPTAAAAIRRDVQRRHEAVLRGVAAASTPATIAATSQQPTVASPGPDVSGPPSGPAREARRGWVAPGETPALPVFGPVSWEMPIPGPRGGPGPIQKVLLQLGLTPPSAGEAWSRSALEAWLEGRMLAVVGGVALLLGAVFFLSLAFSRGWITEPMRVLVGLAAGAVLLILGELSFTRLRGIIGHVLVAVGLATISLALFAATLVAAGSARANPPTAVPGLPTEIGRAVGLSPSAVTQVSDRLERRGMVERVFQDEDRRVRKLKLTDMGLRLMQTHEAKQLQRITAALNGLSGGELEQMTAGLEILTRCCNGTKSTAC